MPVKSKVMFVCQQCGARRNKWIGNCPECHAWNAYAEESISFSKKGGAVPKSASFPTPITEIPTQSEKRIKIGINELDRILGGGIVEGSVILIGGEPGIGKSTLLLQVAGKYAKADRKVLFVSGEESGRQIKMRAERIQTNIPGILLLAENSLFAIEEQIKKLKPDMVIVDSIQTVSHPDFSSAPGSVGQVRESASSFQVLAKNLGIPIFIVGHITKDGSIAGPRVLEHIVDTVLYFEGDANYSYRMLRATKNRFGASNEVAVFAMQETGLEEITNPSEVFLSGKAEGSPGSVTVCVMEGTRPLMIELQALVSAANYGMPQRVTSGIDGRRLSLLLAVIEKSANMTIGTKDVFLNVVGGIKIIEPAADLGVVCSVISSSLNCAIPSKICVLGEVGLGGEIRPVGKISERLKEAEKLGFSECLLPAKSISAKTKVSLRLTGVNTIDEVVKWLRGKK